VRGEESGLAARLAAVRQRIDRACAEAGRDPATVGLVAVSKQQPAARIAAAIALGLVDLGESYAQELTQHQQQFPGVRWHFIGHLQRNKVKLVVPGCELLHSLDSARLLEAVGQRAREAGVVQQVLIEVSTEEATKTGLPPAEVPALAARIVAEPGVRLVGLMGMAPFDSPPAQASDTFRRLRTLRDELEQRLGRSLPTLSMGMSGDLEQAVSEGATLVRVGEALFGPRQAR
jgi:pyridoxal phosphate enzyme (YggS family)